MSVCEFHTCRRPSTSEDDWGLSVCQTHLRGDTGLEERVASRVRFLRASMREHAKRIHLTSGELLRQRDGTGALSILAREVGHIAAQLTECASRLEDMENVLYDPESTP